MPKIIRKKKEYAGGSSKVANNVSYTNATSGLNSDNVQNAIDELASKDGNTDISSIGDGTITGAIKNLNDRLIVFEIVEE